MANHEDDWHYKVLAARWEDLMRIRGIFISQGQNPASIDADLAKVFNPSAYDAIGERLRKADQLCKIGRRMEEWGIDTTSIKFAITNVFITEANVSIDQDVVKWEQLAAMRAQMKGIGVGTDDIDRFIADLFEVKKPEAVAPPDPIEVGPCNKEGSVGCAQIVPGTQALNGNEIVKTRSTLTAKNMKRASKRRPISSIDTATLRRSARGRQVDAELSTQADSIISTVSFRAATKESAPFLETRAIAPERVKKLKLDFWPNVENDWFSQHYGRSYSSDDGFFIPFGRINAEGVLCERTKEIYSLAFVPDPKIQMLVIRGERPCQKPVTFNYPGLQWFPKALIRAIRVKYDPRVRLVSIDQHGTERFADVEFFKVEQFSLLLMHLRKISDIVVEFVEKYLAL
ncbi:hypothetical protein P7C71_g767, partial [Lecanoromycetidae sp. Uapishka_2]